MNIAYVDGSFAPPQPHAGSSSAYGVVLLRPSEGLVALSGVLDAPDCNVAELRAVLAAVEYAPSGPLTVYTDNTSVLAALGRGGPFLEEAQAIRQAVSRRGIDLRLLRAERHHRHMRVAHQLAQAARRGEPLDMLEPYAEADLRRVGSALPLTVSVRRVGESSSVQVSANSPYPRSVEVLLAALSLALPQETLRVVGATRLAAALWQEPRRALDPQLRLRLRQHHDLLKERQVTVLFERTQ